VSGFALLRRRLFHQGDLFLRQAVELIDEPVNLAVVLAIGARDEDELPKMRFQIVE
jgi:hypothetical protein